MRKNLTFTISVVILLILVLIPVVSIGNSLVSWNFFTIGFAVYVYIKLMKVALYFVSLLQDVVSAVHDALV